MVDKTSTSDIIKIGKEKKRKKEKRVDKTSTSDIINNRKGKNKMKRQTLTIYGETFELFKADGGATVNFNGTGAAYDEIYEVYDRPSYAKVGIWHYWCEWCYRLNKYGSPCELMIASHNYMQFSIAGKVQYNGHVYDLWITKAHNRAYLIA